MMELVPSAHWVDVGSVDSLADVAGADRESECVPHTAGMTPATVRNIWQHAGAAYRTGAYPALTLCVRRRGRIVLNRSLGYAHGGGPGETLGGADALPAQPQTPICLFSASKAITAVLVHKLAEEGGIDTSRPVAHYVPEFGANGKNKVTIDDVLCHRGGFPSFQPPAGVDLKGELLTDWDECIRLICQAPARHPGRVAYHAVTGGFILGEVIQRVTGAPLSEYLDTRLRQPLGMRYFTYGLDSDDRKDAATNYIAGWPVSFPISYFAHKALSVPFDEVVEVSNQDYFFDAVVPAGNLYSTAEELSRFYQMLLDGGVYEGRQVLKEETVRAATQPVGWLAIDRTLKVPLRYSRGLIRGGNPVGLYGPMTGQAFGHLGFMNILGWADPARETSVALLTTGKSILGSHLPALGALLMSIARGCR